MCGGEGLCVRVCISTILHVHEVCRVWTKYTDSTHEVYRVCAEVCRVCTELNYTNMYTLLHMFEAVHTCTCACSKKEREG